MSVKEWRTTHGDKVEIHISFADLDHSWGPQGGYRYRVRARNGRIVEVGSEGYTRKSAAIKAARRHHPEVAA